jgi:prepilin-type N-terminal cleavage/methylation domain-containing protein
MTPSNVDARRQPLPRLRRTGLSLIEVLITVAVIGIMAGVVLPQMQAGVPDRLTATAEIIVADLEYGRSLAVANGSTYRITFEPANNRYSLAHSGASPALAVLPYSPFRASDDPPGKQTTALSDLLFGKPGVQLIAVLRQSGGGVEVSDVEFTALGGTTRSDATIVWVGCGTQSGRRYVPLTIQPTTGLVEIGEITTKLPAGVQDRGVSS